MKDMYKGMEMEIIRFEMEDVIATSSELPVIIDPDD